ncbi:uncharacterized protein C2orf72 homolog isoform X1 [Ornithorhynchus anatinus]|uniref:uncharacterized protein C2orf72 homolog isoform X1 n=1 Tax=Ornithorhynchus anatinus TaxID=9258 RepID=UPI0010A77C44|nr:uncharacterized protein C2orf72 homolog isoform X1 [Ornithorhynchus anatinus]
MESPRSDGAASPSPGESSDERPQELVELVQGQVLLVGEQWGQDRGTKLLRDFAQEIGPRVHKAWDRAVSPPPGPAAGGGADGRPGSPSASSAGGRRPGSLSGEAVDVGPGSPASEADSRPDSRASGPGGRGTKRKAEESPEARRSESAPTVAVPEPAGPEPGRPGSPGPRLVFFLSRASSLRAQRPGLRHILRHVRARVAFPPTELVGVVVAEPGGDPEEGEEEEEEARRLMAGLLVSAFPRPGPELHTAVFRAGRAVDLVLRAPRQGSPESRPPTPLGAQRPPFPPPPPGALPPAPEGPVAQARSPSPEGPAVQAHSWEETQAALWAEAQGGPTAPPTTPTPHHPPDGAGNRLLEAMSSKAVVLTALGAAAVAAGAAGAAYYTSEH